MLAEVVNLSLSGAQKVLSSLGDIDDRIRGITGRPFDIDTTSSVLAFSELRDTALSLTSTLKDLSKEFVNTYLAQDTASVNASTLTDDISGLERGIAKSVGSLNNSASKTDLLTASYDLLSAGISETSDLTSVLESATKGAVGGLSDVATVGDFTTNVLNSYGDGLSYMGDTQERANKIISQGIAVQNLGKTTLGAYAATAGSAANVASTFGQKLESFNSIIAKATKSGIPLETTLSGIAGAYSAIASPTAEAQAEAEKLGITFDAQTLASKGFVGILEEIKATSPDAAQSLTKIFGDISAFSVASSVANDLEDYNSILGQVTNSSGLLESQFEKVDKSAQSVFNRFENIKTDALASLGKGVFLFFEPAISLVTQVIGLFTRLPQPIQTTAGVLLGATVAMGTLLGVVTVVAGVIPTLSIAWGALTAAIGGNIIATNSSTVASAANSAGLIIKNGLLLATSIASKGAAAATLVFTAAQNALTANLTIAGAAQAASNFVMAQVPALMAGGTAALGVFKGGLIAAGVAIKGFLATLAPLAPVLALGVVGIAAFASIWETLNARFKESEGEKAASDLALLNDEAEELNDSLSNLKEETGEGFLSTIKQDFKDGGVFNIIQANLVRTESFLRTGSTEVSTYGNTWVKTSKQVKNAQETIGLEQVFKETGNTVKETQSLITEFGLNQVDAGDAARLGASGINTFNEKAAEQGEKIDKTIAVLKGMSLEVGANKDAIATEINTLESFKASLQNRTKDLNDFANQNKEVAKDLGTVEDQLKALDSAFAAANLKTEVSLGSAEVSGLSNVSSSVGSDVVSGVVDSQKLSENIKSQEEYIAKMRELLEKEGADKEAINQKIAESEAALNDNLKAQQEERIATKEKTIEALKNASTLEAEIEVENARSREDREAAELNLIAVKRKGGEEELARIRENNSEALSAAQKLGATKEQLALLTAQGREAELTQIKENAALEREEVEKIAAIKLAAIERTIEKGRQVSEISNLESEIAAQGAKTSEERDKAELSSINTRKSGLKSQLAIERQAGQERIAIAREQGKGEEEIATLVRENKISELSLVKQVGEAEQAALKKKIDIREKALKLTVDAGKQAADIATLEGEIALANARTTEETAAAELNLSNIKIQNAQNLLDIERSAGQERLSIAKEQGLSDQEIAGIKNENQIAEMEFVKEIAEEQKAAIKEITALKIESSQKTMDALIKERELATSQLNLSTGGNEEAGKSLQAQDFSTSIAARQAYLEEITAIAANEAEVNEDLRNKIIETQTSLNNDLAKLNNDRIKQQEELIGLYQSFALKRAELRLSNAQGIEEEIAAQDNLTKVKREGFEYEFRAIQEREAIALKSLAAVGASEQEVKLTRGRYANERIDLELKVSEFEKQKRQEVADKAIAEIERVGGTRSAQIEQEIVQMQALGAVRDAGIGLGKSLLTEQSLKNQLLIEELNYKKIGLDGDAEKLAIENKILAIKRGERLAELEFKENELQANLASFELEQTILALKNEQASLELQIALEKAKQNGASEKEIALINQQIESQKKLMAAQEQAAQLGREAAQKDISNVGLERDIAKQQFKNEDKEAGRREVKPIKQDPVRTSPQGEKQKAPTNYNINVTAPDPFAQAEKLIQSTKRQERYGA